LPAERPRNFGEVLPRGGFSGLFDVTALPTDLKVSYRIWVIDGLLGLLGGMIGHTSRQRRRFQGRELSAGSVSAGWPAFGIPLRNDPPRTC
jgi:hypothetical protein